MRMHRRYTVLLLIALYYAVPAQAGKKRKALFLGNSYTYYNNMPQLVADMAASTGDTLVWDMYAPGGYTFDNHGQDATSLNKIKAGGWDYLVLQEQSQLPSFPFYFSNELYGMCATFRQYNPCGRIMFYMTWGRKNGDAMNCPGWPPVCTYSGMDSLIRLRYEDMAVNYNAELSPAGAAWRYTRAHYPGINLYEPDESHPSTAGSYLVASSFYAAVFKKDPTLVSYNFSLGSADAASLRQSAKAVVFDSLSYWDHGVTVPTAGFSYLAGTGINEVICTNTSKFADTYLWDFGDGFTTTVQHPKHSYANNGTYTITLKAYNCDIDSTYISTYQSTVSFCPFTPTITPPWAILCPAVSDTLSTQVYDAYQWYDIAHNIVPGATGQSLITSVANDYYVKATKNGCTEMSVPARVELAVNLFSIFIDPAGNLVGQDSACIGDTIALAVSFDKPPVTNDSLMDWSYNGQPVTGYHNDTLWATKTGIYEVGIHHVLCPALIKKQQVSMTFVNCPLHIGNVGTAQFVIAPNPARDVLQVTSALFLSGAYTISITDQYGQTLYKQPNSVDVRQQIDMSGYNSGMYFIHIAQQDKILFRAKVMKQ